MSNTIEFTLAKNFKNYGVYKKLKIWRSDFFFVKLRFDKKEIFEISLTIYCKKKFLNIAILFRLLLTDDWKN